MRPTKTGGQALVEMSIVVFLLVLLASGIIEFGRLFMIGNMITHAARDGARFAATLPVNSGENVYREENGCFTGAGSDLIVNHVRDMIETVMDDAGTFDDIAVTQGLDGGIPTVTVQVNGTMGIIVLRGMIDDIDVARTMTFRDEQRALGEAC